jgi:hypothetical protein
MKLMVQELQRQLEEIEETKGHLREKKTMVDLKMTEFYEFAGPTPENTPAAAPKPPPRRQNPFNKPVLGENGANSSSSISKGTSKFFFFILLDFNWLLSNYLFICFLSKLFFANFNIFLFNDFVFAQDLSKIHKTDSKNSWPKQKRVL